jgi:hypothetical protein
MNIAFIDHPLHKKTRSSDFFIDILRKDHDVTIYYPGSEWRVVLDSVLNAGHQLAICWQHEFFAPPLVAHGLPSIIIPMYDGAGGMPKTYWSVFAEMGISSINFSANLNHQHLQTGIESSYIQYYPDPKDFELVEDFESLRGFLWQRQPDSHINWHTIMRLTCGQLESLHIHDVPDGPIESDIPQMQDWPLLEQKIKSTRWFEKKQDFIHVMHDANVFFTPRHTEGIGMALLEAMAQGQCVVAHNASTHNEYIQHGNNGLLVDMQHPMPIDLSSAKKLGRAARITVEAGYEKWKQASDIINWKIGRALNLLNPLSQQQRRQAKSFPSNYFKGYKI